MIRQIKKGIDIIFTNKKYWLLPLVILVVMYILLFSDFGLINYISLKTRKYDLEQSIRREEIRSDSLVHRITQLKYDSLEIEKIARIYYGMLKPGEKLYIYREKPKRRDN